MKLVTIIQIVQIWMTGQSSYLAADHIRMTEEGYMRSTQCYNDQDKLLECLDNKSAIRILTARYWFYNCIQQDSCCTGNPITMASGPINMLPEPDCQKDIFQEDETKHQEYVEACSGKKVCTPKMRGVRGQQTTSECPQHSNYVSITYQCVNSNNIMNFCGQFIKKQLAHGFIETTNYPQMHNERSCWCLLNATAPITKFKIVQANNTNAKFNLSYFGSSYEDILSLDGSYIVNQNVTNLSIQSALINTGTLAPSQLSIYFELQGASMVQFQCWNGTMPPIATTISIVSTVNTKATTTTGSSSPTTSSTKSSIFSTKQATAVITTTDSITQSSTAPGTSITTSETLSLPMNNKNQPEGNNNLAPIVGGTLGSIVILVIITFIAVMVVRSYRKKSKASKQPSTQIDGDPNYHDIPDLLVNSGATNLQMTNGVQISNFDDTEAYEEIPDNSQYTNTYGSLNHDRHYTHLKQDKINQKQKSSTSTQSKTCSNKGTNEMPEYAKVNKKKKEPTAFEFESEDILGDTTNRPIYAKVNKPKTEPNFFELDPQDNRTASKDDQHDYFEKNKTDFQISNPTHFEIESGFAGGAVHSKADETDYAYTYAHFNRDPSKKGTQEHADDDDADKVIFTDNDIYDTDKVEFIDNDVYNTS